MTDDRKLGGFDYFKLSAAFLVAAIHTSPLASFSGQAETLMTFFVPKKDASAMISGVFDQVSPSSLERIITMLQAA